MLGARGGAGTTTVAAAMAVFAGGHLPTELVSGDAAPLLAIAAPDAETTSIPVTAGLSLVAPAGGAGHPIGNRTGNLTGGGNLVVIDGGNLAHPGFAGNGNGNRIELVVLRGPCHLGLHTLMSCQERPAGIILVEEKGRSLSERDVEEVLGVPVVVRVPHSEAVARCIDAGLLVARLHQLLEFRELNRYVAGLLGPVPPAGWAA